MDIAAIGRKVKSLREARGLKQKPLAVLAGIHKNTLLALENGHAKGSTLETLDLLATALKIPVADLLAAGVKKTRKRKAA